MTPSEFLFKLKNLPPETPLTANHIIAVLEALSPSTAVKQVENVDNYPNSKLIDEDLLADWIGESVNTLKKWRVTGKGPKYIKKPKNIAYRVGDVRDWIDNLTVASTAEGHVRLNRFEGDYFKPIPYMLTTSEPVPFFESLSLDEECIEGFALEYVEYYESPQHNLTAWLYQQLGDHFLSDLLPEMEEHLRAGADINQVAKRVVSNELVEFTIADLVAHFQGIDQSYGDFLFTLLDKKLDTSNVENPTEQFQRALNSYNLYHKLRGSVKKEIPYAPDQGGKL